jgi:hypothetical protein
VRSKITKQEKEQQITTQRIAERKQEQEKLNNRRDTLINQINATRLELKEREELKEQTIRDREIIKNIYRQMNPGKKQPT